MRRGPRTTQPDFSYDQVWDSEGRVTDKGWMALVAIPFRSLRFRRSGPDWGVVFARNLPRNSEIDYWPRVAANISGTLSQEGTLHGMEGLTGSHNIADQSVCAGAERAHADRPRSAAIPISARGTWRARRAGSEGDFEGQHCARWDDQSRLQHGGVRPAAVHGESAVPGVFSGAAAVLSGECELLRHADPAGVHAQHRASRVWRAR